MLALLTSGQQQHRTGDTYRMVRERGEVRRAVVRRVQRRVRVGHGQRCWHVAAGCGHHHGRAAGSADGGGLVRSGVRR